MGTATKVTVETSGHILMIGLNRPEKYNAFDLDLYTHLGIAYGELHRNSELRCVVLFAQRAPWGVQTTLSSSRTASIEGGRVALANLLPDLARIMKSADAWDGTQSFVERRKGNFVGR